MQLKKYVVSLLAVALSTAAFALPSPLPLPDQADTNKAVEEYLAQLAQVQEQANAFNQVVLPALKGIAQEVGNKNLDDLTEAQQEKVLEYAEQFYNKLDEGLNEELKAKTDFECDLLVKNYYIQQLKQTLEAKQITADEYKAMEADLQKTTFSKEDYKEIQELLLATSLLAGYVATDALSEVELSCVVKVFYPDQEKLAINAILQLAKQLKEQNEQLEDLFSKMGISDEEQK